MNLYFLSRINFERHDWTVWTTQAVTTSFTWYSLFWFVFHRRTPDCRRRNETRCQDDPGFCWWTWWTPRPVPEMIQLLNIFILIVNFILMGILNYEGIVFPAAELAIIKSCNKTILMPPNVSWSISAAFGECNDAMSQGTVVMNQCRVRCGPPHEACHRHNSDLRDFHVYIQTQVWRERILTRQCSMRFDKKTRQY